MTLDTSCQLVTLFTGMTQVCFMSAPVGSCNYCCPRDEKLDIRYQLFTRRNPRKFQLIQINDTIALARSNFDFSYPTVIYLMGFTEATTGPATTAVRDAYISSGNYNFIAVDWARLIAFPWYITALRNTRYMGRHLAKFVRFLDAAGVPASSLHVIGFSLGAEAAGFAGKALKAQGLLLGRITGLDPAFPGYSLTNSSAHLARGDAAFVDIIHTNPGLFGIPVPIGDVDFYPNHGSWSQPGCWFFNIIKNRVLIYACSHNRAWRLYVESVGNPMGFPATLCSDWKSATSPCQFNVDGYLGFIARPPMFGKMYLETNSAPPFARNGP